MLYKVKLKDNAISLVPGLNPTVVLSNKTTKLLGDPYSKCNNQKNYSQLTCELNQFMAKVIDFCNCFQGDNFTFYNSAENQVSSVTTIRTKLVHFLRTTKM